MGSTGGSRGFIAGILGLVYVVIMFGAGLIFGSIALVGSILPLSHQERIAGMTGAVVFVALFFGMVVAIAVSDWRKRRAKRRLEEDQSTAGLHSQETVAEESHLYGEGLAQDLGLEEE
jgi:hypothetical protein